MMLIPAETPQVHAFGAIVLAVILTIELAWVAHMRITDGGDTLPWLVYRLGIPLAACVVLFAGGVGMLVASGMAVAAPAAFVFALFVVGVQDAFDLLLGERGTRRPRTSERLDAAARASNAQSAHEGVPSARLEDDEAGVTQ
jgi:hypothetical protein